MTCPSKDGLPWYLDLDRRPWEAYRTAPYIVVDLETTNLDKGDPCNPKNRIVLTCSYSTHSGDTRLGMPALIEHLPPNSPCILIAHNAKFELGWLQREGVDTTNLLPWDTMIAEYVLAGNRQVPLDLGSVAKRYGLAGKGRLIDALMKNGVCPSEMPEHLLRRRVESDVRVTHEIFLRQRDLIEKAGLTKVMFSRCIVTPVLAAMETEGMRLDPERVAREHDRLLQRRAELGSELTVLAGGKNLRSGPQLAEVLYTDLGFREPTDRSGQPLRTATGRPRTDRATLADLTGETPEQKRFLKLQREYGECDSLLTKNVEFFQKVVTEREGRFFAQFHQTRTRTHRLSSSGKRICFGDGTIRGVQFQNLPRQYKSLFRASPGRVMVEADGAQLEFRVAGSLSRDPQVLRDVQTGADVHRFTASILRGIPEDQVTAKQRTAAKSHTFKPMYGGRSGTARERAYYAAFRDKYRTMYDTQTGWTMEVLATGKLRTATGLTFYWPGTVMSRDGYVSNSASIFNYPVQSLATAEIIPIALTYLFHLARTQLGEARIVNTVHDSVVAEVPETGLDKWRELVVESFLDRTYEYLDKVYGIDLYVPLGVSIKAGSHWGEGEESTVSYPYKDG